MLSDRDIREALESGELAIDPLADSQIQPASVDLALGNEFATLPSAHPIFPAYVDPLSAPTDQLEHTEVDPGCSFALPPLGFALATTVETVRIGMCLVGILAGKSSLARHGLMVEAAGYVDPGFQGQLTLELFNQHKDRTIILTPGMLIAQIAIQNLSSPCRYPYGSRHARSHYQGQAGPTGSRSHIPGGTSCQGRTKTRNL